MSTFGLCFSVCLRAALPIAALGAALCWGTELSTGQLSYALHLSAFSVALAASQKVIDFWPLFARDAAGADFVRRQQKGPFHGSLAAGAGSLAAAAACLLLLALATAALLPEQRAHRRLQPQSQPLLDGAVTSADFALGAAASELRLRPVVLLPPAAPEAARIEVLADGAPLLPEPFAVLGDRQLMRIPLDGRRLDVVTVRRTAGNLPLLFPEGSVTAPSATTMPRAAAAAMALLLWLLPQALALAVAWLLAPLLGRPVALVAAAAAMLVQTLGANGPASAGVTALLRGQWLPTEPVLARSTPSLLVGIAVLLLAMAQRAWRR
jgi:hypothetical protein